MTKVYNGQSFTDRPHAPSLSLFVFRLATLASAGKESLTTILDGVALPTSFESAKTLPINLPTWYPIHF